MSELDRLVAEVRAIREKDLPQITQALARIEARCEPCRATVEHHRVILDGDNGRGLRSRVALAEQSLESIRRDQRTTLRWFRVQLGALIAALLGFLALVGQSFFGR